MNRTGESGLLRIVIAFLYLASGLMFLLTLVELSGLKHWADDQLLPWTVCVVGLAALVISWLRPQRRLGYLLSLVMLGVILSGAVGVAEHGEANLADGPSRTMSVRLVFAADASAFTKLVHGFSLLFAPLALSGGGLIGIVGMEARVFLEDPTGPVHDRLAVPEQAR